MDSRERVDTAGRRGSRQSISELVDDVQHHPGVQVFCLFMVALVFFAHGFAFRSREAFGWLGFDWVGDIVCANAVVMIGKFWSNWRFAGAALLGSWVAYWAATPPASGNPNVSAVFATLLLWLVGTATLSYVLHIRACRDGAWQALATIATVTLIVIP